MAVLGLLCGCCRTSVSGLESLQQLEVLLLASNCLSSLQGPLGLVLQLPALMEVGGQDGATNQHSREAAGTGN